MLYSQPPSHGTAIMRTELRDSIAVRGWENVDTRDQAVNRCSTLPSLPWSPKKTSTPSAPPPPSASLWLSRACGRLRAPLWGSGYPSQPRPCLPGAPPTRETTPIGEAPPRRAPPRRLTLQDRRSSSSTAAGWCGGGSPTRAPRAGRTAPSSRPAASGRWRPSSARRLSAGR